MSLTNTMVSKLPDWVTIANNWRYPEKVADYLPGVMAAEEVNRILSNAPSDVGGTISFNVTQFEAKELYRRWHIMQNFNNSIHYEIAELIDIPFTQSMGPVLDDVYSLNPKEFKTDFQLFKKRETLESLLLDVITDSAAKASFESLAEELNTDAASEELEALVAEAAYWEAEFIKAEKIGDIKDNFLAEHGKAWDTYTADQKKYYLSEYAIEAGMVMGINDFYTGGVTIKWFSEDPKSSPDAYGYTRSQQRDGMIYLNDSFINEDPANFSLTKVLSTTVHEVRHQYQAQAIYIPNKYNLPTVYQMEWFNYKKYPDKDDWIRPWEIDARAFAGLTQL